MKEAWLLDLGMVERCVCCEYRGECDGTCRKDEDDEK